MEGGTQRKQRKRNEQKTKQNEKTKKRKRNKTTGRRKQAEELTTDPQDAEHESTIMHGTTCYSLLIQAIE